MKQPKSNGYQESGPNALWWSIRLVQWFSRTGLSIGFAMLAFGILWALFAEFTLVPHMGQWHVLPVALGLIVLLLHMAVRRGA